MSLKHVGRIKKNQRKIVVAYRTVPGEPDNCVVVTTENLMADEHDALMKCVESDAGQSAYEFAEAMSRTQMPDGRNMLSGLHTTGKMMKMQTAQIEMIPDRNTSVALDELNKQIADQKGVSIEDLALGTAPAQNNTAMQESAVSEPVVEQETVATAEPALNDEELAAKYRSDADRMFKEAKRLREQADELAPKKAKESSDG